VLRRYVIPFRGNAFVSSPLWTGSQVPDVLNCSAQIANDPNDIDFDVTGCISAISQKYGPNWLYGFQTFHAAADALFLINQVQPSPLQSRNECFNHESILSFDERSGPRAAHVLVASESRYCGAMLVSYICVRSTLHHARLRWSITRSFPALYFTRDPRYAESLGTRTANMMQLLHHYKNSACVSGQDQRT
jgi:hypothetical protein